MDRAGKVAYTGTGGTSGSRGGAPRRHRRIDQPFVRKDRCHVDFVQSSTRRRRPLCDRRPGPSAAGRREGSAAGPPTAVIVSGPDVGRRAPTSRLPWANKDGVGPADAPYELWRDRGKTVVVAFYPRDFTSGCTAEMRTFAEQYDSLFGPDVVVVGISTDSVETHARFAASLNLPFRLLSDPRAGGGRASSGADGESGYMRRGPSTSSGRRVR